MSSTPTSHTQQTVAQPSPGTADDDGDPTEFHDPTPGHGNPLVLIGCGKQKRDPESHDDLRTAVPPETEVFRHSSHGITTAEDVGPAWQAKDLYTSTYFQLKRQYATALTTWTRDPPGWGILSAKHAFLWPFEPVTPYDHTVEDLGDDPTNPAHRVSNEFDLRCPDGRTVVTEQDMWARRVALGIASFVASHRDSGSHPADCSATSLLVLAGQRYLTPLRERGVFEYGISRLTGDPNSGYTFPVDPIFVFEEIDANGIGAQMSWLQTAIDRAGGVPAHTTQREINAFTDRPERYCDRCGVKAQQESLTSVDGVVVCNDCAPSRCARCDNFTFDSGIGGFPLCADCQTDTGNRMISEEHDSEPPHTQLPLDRFSQ